MVLPNGRSWHLLHLQVAEGGFRWMGSKVYSMSCPPFAKYVKIKAVLELSILNVILAHYFSVNYLEQKSSFVFWTSTNILRISCAL